jgi:hypothetical protein
MRPRKETRVCIDDHERRQGRLFGRPRRKLVDRNQMIALAEDNTVAAPPTAPTNQSRRTP